MNETPFADHDATCDAPRLTVSKRSISRLHVAQIDTAPDAILILRFARQHRAVPGEHPLHQAAAVESRRVAAAIPVWNSQEIHCRLNEVGQGSRFRFRSNGGRLGNGWRAAIRWCGGIRCAAGTGRKSRARKRSRRGPSRGASGGDERHEDDQRTSGHMCNIDVTR